MTMDELRRIRMQLALAQAAADRANQPITEADFAASNVDGTAGKASIRTLGTGAQQACAGNDARLSDARTPVAHSHAGTEVTIDTTVYSGSLAGERPATLQALAAWIDAHIVADV